MLKRFAVVLVALLVSLAVVSVVPEYWLPWYPAAQQETERDTALVRIPLEGSPFTLPFVFAQDRKLGDTTVTGTINYCSDAGANDSYACNLAPALPAYTTGACYVFKANTANTGAATIALNGLSAITIKKVAGGVTTDLSDNDIRSGQLAFVCYDGTNMQLQSTLGNAASGTDTGFAFVGGGEEPVGSGATTYRGTMKNAFDGTPGYVAWTSPADCTARNLRVRTITAQPGTGTMVVTLYNVDSASNTALTLTISAGASAGLFSDTSNTVSITAGTSLALKFVNNASASSATMRSWAIQCN